MVIDMSDMNLQNKFDGMNYETAVNKLNSLIGILEKGEGTLDELMAVYKEALEYYNFCSEYLSKTGQKIMELNASLTEPNKIQGGF